MTGKDRVASHQPRTREPPDDRCRLSLRALAEKSADADMLREMIGFAAQRLLELEVAGLTGAAHGEKTPERRRT